MSSATLAFIPPEFSWRRSSALGATLSLHAAALLAMLAPPIAYELARRPKDETAITVVVKEPEPPPPQVIEPPQPRPFVPKPTPLQRPVTPPAPPIAANELSPMATPAPLELPIASTSTDIAPTETAPTPLAYGSRTYVPYPTASARRHEQGRVVLRVLIGSDGTPQRVEVEKSSGFPLLDRAAREAVAKWRFTPGTRNGVPYPAWGHVPVEFHLDAG